MRFLNGDIQEFRAAVKGKCLVCFGAGRVLRNFLEEYAAYHLEQDILCIADNRSGQLPAKVRIAGREIPVVSAAQLAYMENIAILISCRAVADVYKQLEAYPELKGVSCWAANFIRSETRIKLEQLRWYPTVLRLALEPLIPKKIHYCWFGRKPIPQKNLEWMASWKKYCPDYEVIRWDEDNYDVTKNAYMHEAYKAGKWGFVSDYARLDIIYHYGGIYLDTDVELIRSLDDLLYQKAFAGIDRSRDISLGLGFGAQEGCQIIKELMDMYETVSLLNKDGTYNLTVAPALQRTFFQKKGYINNGEYQLLKDMTVYPEKVLSPKCNWTGRILLTVHSFSIHHYDGSWTTENDQAIVASNIELYTQICGEGDNRRGYL